MMYVVVYDISDSRRRRRLHDQLLNYGTGVQYSVFEIEERCLDGALKVCARELAPKDKVRIYHLCARCSKTVRVIGPGRPPADELELPDVIEVKRSKLPVSVRRSTGPLERGYLDAPSRLMGMICSMQNLRDAFSDVRSNRGCAGSDGVSIAAFGRHLAQNLASLQGEMICGSYEPGRLRVFHIEKRQGGVRVLKVPTVRDRVAQQAALLVIAPVWERELEDCSFAYRKGRSIRQVVSRVKDWHAKGREWVARTDIDDFFDQVKAEEILKRFSSRVHDETVVSLMRKWLTVVSSETIGPPEKLRGLPQGSGVSPLLSNIYLDRFDEAIGKLGYHMIRYADDMLLVCSSEDEATDAIKDVRRELVSDGLSLNDEKTLVTTFGKGFEFLGYTFVGRFAFRVDKAKGLRIVTRG